MTVRKRRKFSRLRGSHTHGWGSKKKHRGAGNRGGKGMAGTGKRADSKKPNIWKNKKYFGKHGFVHHGALKKIDATNISYIDENIDKFVEKKLAEKQGDIYVVDAKKLGFNKILSGGKATRKYKIIAPYFSAKVEEKIKAAGGEAVKIAKEVIKKPEPKEEEK